MDKEIQCVGCPDIFIFTAGEQKFYKDKGHNEPKRCPQCRLVKKQRYANPDAQIEYPDDTGNEDEYSRN